MQQDESFVTITFIDQLHCAYNAHYTPDVEETAKTMLSSKNFSLMLKDNQQGDLL